MAAVDRANPTTQRTVRLGDIDLHVVEAGSGSPVVLLHGFPEFWYSWRHQILALAGAGFRAVAPDLRGYNQSGKPPGVRFYRVWQLVDDVARLIQWLGDEPVCVVGHDWGGVIAWRLAATRPQLVKKLVILNAPHPARFARELKRNALQWLRSSYALFFQLPWVPEAVLRLGDFALLERQWRRQPVRPRAFTDEDIAQYKRALNMPHGLTAPLNYYRAAVRWPGDLYDLPQSIAAPTLVLWGERDPFLSTRLLEGLSPWVPDLRVERFPNASHWLQNDAPVEVNRALIEFCGSAD
jgi:pimeloyl-ACP methyl ester carboxylesterase